jgi:hypothetical protein
MTIDRSARQKESNESKWESQFVNERVTVSRLPEQSGHSCQVRTSIEGFCYQPVIICKDRE